MNLTLFYENTDTILKSFQSTGIINSLRAIIPLITAYRTDPNETTRVALEQAVDKAEDGFIEINRANARVPHSDYFISVFKIDKVLNPDYTSFVRNLVYNDLFTAHEKIEALATECERILSTFNGLITHFKALDFDFGAEEKHYLVGFEFLGDASVENTKELEDYLSSIRKILYKYACLSEEVAESNPPTLHTISKGSPLIIDLSWAQDNLPHILRLIGLTVLFYLSKKEDVQKITEFEQLVIKEIPEKERTKLFDKAFEAQRNRMFNQKAVDKHVQDLIKKSGGKSKTGRSKSEQESYLRKGVRDLIDLLNRGIKVEVHKPTSEETKDSDSKSIEETAGLIYTKYRITERKSKSFGINVKLKLPKNSSDKK